MKYYVLSRLNHNTKIYEKGHEIDLEKGSDAATALLDAGVISTEPIDAPSTATTAPVEDEAAKQPEVGGSRPETGEPSLDGEGDSNTSGDAEDVTPVVSERMTRDELEAAAREKGVDEKEIEAAPNKGALVDLITAHKPAEEPKEPEVDPSANL